MTNKTKWVSLVIHHKGRILSDYHHLKCRRSTGCDGCFIRFRCYSTTSEKVALTMKEVIDNFDLLSDKRHCTETVRNLLVWKDSSMPKMEISLSKELHKIKRLIDRKLGSNTLIKRRI